MGMKLLMPGDPLASVPERSFIYVCEEWGGVLVIPERQ